MKEPKTLRLKTSVQLGTIGEPIASLSFRPPRARDFRALPLGMHNVGHMLDLASQLCGQPPAILDLLEVDDMAEVLVIVGDFIGAGLGTLTTP
jgi:hypothetical protein